MQFDFFVVRCSKPCTEECPELVNKTCELCDKIYMVPCYTTRLKAKGDKPSTVVCRQECDIKLKCGHKCSGTCDSWYVYSLIISNSTNSMQLDAGKFM